MDGTIVDLYGYNNWLTYLEEENPLPYYNALPLVNMNEFSIICKKFIKAGWKIQIISWLSKNSSLSFQEETRRAKKYWLKKYCNFDFNEIFLIPYGIAKENFANGYTILIDDDKKIRNNWYAGLTIDATKEEWLEELQALI